MVDSKFSFNLVGMVDRLRGRAYYLHTGIGSIHAGMKFDSLDFTICVGFAPLVVGIRCLDVGNVHTSIVWTTTTQLLSSLWCIGIGKILQDTCMLVIFEYHYHHEQPSSIR
jgi:hypothetical protein